MSEQASDALPIGSLLRQPTIQTPEGKEIRFDELLGPGFAIVGRTRGDLELGSEARRIADRLGCRLVTLEGISCTAGELDRTFEASPAIVVRPDRYIFGAVDATTPLDALVLGLGRQIALA